MGLSLHSFSKRRQSRIVLWCNGSTTGFGSVCRGSNPRGTTTQKVEQMLDFLRCCMLFGDYFFCSSNFIEYTFVSLGVKPAER